jgi:predicted metal-binding transcription factor (methanogenesis marker protein 9)
MPTAVMRFQTDGYGSRVEMEENEYFGTGKFAKLTLLCQGQESCFTQEIVNIWNPTESTKKNVGYEIYYFAKKDVAENILKEFVAKK